MMICDPKCFPVLIAIQFHFILDISHSLGLLSSEQTDEWSVATGDDSSSTVGPNSASWIGLKPTKSQGISPSLKCWGYAMETGRRNNR
jgi:hypothetical protein